MSNRTKRVSGVDWTPEKYHRAPGGLTNMDGLCAITVDGQKFEFLPDMFSSLTLLCSCEAGGWCCQVSGALVYS